MNYRIPITIYAVDFLKQVFLHSPPGVFRPFEKILLLPRQPIDITAIAFSPECLSVWSVDK